MFISEDNKSVLQALFFGLAAVITITSSLRYFAYQYEGKDSLASLDVAAEVSSDEVVVSEERSADLDSEESQPFGGVLVRQAFAATAPRVLPVPDRQPDTYQLAIANYADHRLQFDNCVMAYPMISATFKGGTEVLIEGKSLDPQIIYFAGSEIELHGQDLALIRLPKVTKVTEYSIDCVMLDDRQYNVGRVIVYP